VLYHSIWHYCGNNLYTSINGRTSKAKAMFSPETAWLEEFCGIDEEIDPVTRVVVFGMVSEKKLLLHNAAHAIKSVC